jgi:hypothetical protein
MKNFIFTALGVGKNALEKSEKWKIKSGLDFAWTRMVPYSFHFLDPDPSAETVLYF